MSDRGHMFLIFTHNHCRKNRDIGWETSDESVGNVQKLLIYTCVYICTNKIRKSEDFLSTSSATAPIRAVNRCIKMCASPFSSSQTTSLFCFSHTIQPFNLKLGCSLKHFIKNVGKKDKKIHGIIYIIYTKRNCVEFLIL
jgi:hypothetical protein